MSPALFSGLGSHTLLELFVFLGIQMSVEVFEKHLSHTLTCAPSVPMVYVVVKEKRTHS
jgi:hypothetical protein